MELNVKVVNVNTFSDNRSIGSGTILKILLILSSQQTCEIGPVLCLSQKVKLSQKMKACTSQVGLLSAGPACARFLFQRQGSNH